MRTKTTAIGRFLTMTLCVLAVAGLSAQQPPEIKPGAEHEMLKQCEGAWDAVMKCQFGESKGTLQCKMDLNGLWLLDHYTGEFLGKAFSGRGATSYDSGKKKYVSVWIDSMSTSPTVTEGTFDKEKKTLTQTGDMPMGEGKSMKCRMITTFADANSKSFQIIGTGPDGKEFEMLQITYKRRAK